MIVDHEHIDAWVLFQDSGDDARQVVGLVIRGDDHDEARILAYVLARMLIRHGVGSPVSGGRPRPNAKSSAGISSIAVVQSRAITASTTAASLAMIG